MEVIHRPDIEYYEAMRIAESPHGSLNRRVQPSTVNFEIAVLRTSFSFVIHEPRVRMENPCARFEPLRNAVGKAKGRPAVCSQDDLDRLLGACNAEDSAAFTTLLLTGLREQELCYPTWDDVMLEPDRESLVVRRKAGFTPKDDEEREAPIPGELAAVLRARAAGWRRTCRGGRSVLPRAQAWPRPRSTSSVTPVRRGCWRAAPTLGRCSGCWATAIWTPPSATSIPTTIGTGLR